MRLLLIVVGVVALSAPAVAQDAPCDARPRWLIVTVLATAGVDSDGEWVEFGDSGDMWRVGRSSLQIDRCEVSQLQKFEADEHTSLTLTTGRMTWMYQIAETVQQICAAVDDCADATQPSGGE